MLDDELGEERDGEIDLTFASTFIGATPLARSCTMTVSEPLVGKKYGRQNDSEAWASEGASLR